ncbi:T-cell surface antigen CD2 isoform X1 [Strix aluco]|uniref:T-cell surface antigen CD2 isoform X1 n=1 Tax=Strix aluco TaxID=111821 RepID=UPI003DA4C63E
MFLTLNMNFRRIFLVKCLLLLFPSVKCSVAKWIYMAVNESALLSIAVAGNVYDATWLKDRKKLIQIKDKKVKYYVNKEQCRCKIFLNGTLQIEQVVKEDSGKYTVTVYHQDGKLNREEDTMFMVQEPVPQPILSAECMNKTVSVKCEVKHKTKDETFMMELTQDNHKKIQKNATRLELHTWYSGTFRCVVKNQVSEKTAEKVIKCSGRRKQKGLKTMMRSERCRLARRAGKWWCGSSLRCHAIPPRSSCVCSSGRCHSPRCSSKHCPHGPGPALSSGLQTTREKDLEHLPWEGWWTLCSTIHWEKKVSNSWEPLLPSLA